MRIYARESTNIFIRYYYKARESRISMNICAFAHKNIWVNGFQLKVYFPLFAFSLDLQKMTAEKCKANQNYPDLLQSD